MVSCNERYHYPFALHKSQAILFSVLHRASFTTIVSFFLQVKYVPFLHLKDHKSVTSTSGHCTTLGNVSGPLGLDSFTLPMSASEIDCGLTYHI